MGRYIKIALGLLAWTLLGALMAGCGYTTNQALGEGTTPAAQATPDPGPTLGTTPAITPTLEKSWVLKERSTWRRANAGNRAHPRTNGPDKTPSRATKPRVRSRTVDVLVWPRLQEVRISSQALREARFRSRLVRQLEGTRGVASARAGSSPAGVSIYLRLSPRHPDLGPPLDFVVRQIKSHLGEGVKIRLLLVDRQGKPLPVGCGCPLPPTS